MLKMLSTFNEIIRNCLSYISPSCHIIISLSTLSQLYLETLVSHAKNSTDSSDKERQRPS